MQQEKQDSAVSWGGSAHMTISFLVVSKDMKSTHFFSSSYVCERSTIFWNMVRFLEALNFTFYYFVFSQHEHEREKKWKKKKKRKKIVLTWNKEPGQWRWWQCPWDGSHVPPVVCSGSGRCSATEEEMWGDRQRGWADEVSLMTKIIPAPLTSSPRRNFPNSRWWRSKMDEPCSLARGLPDLSAEREIPQK